MRVAPLLLLFFAYPIAAEEPKTAPSPIGHWLGTLKVGGKKGTRTLVLTKSGYTTTKVKVRIR